MEKSFPSFDEVQKIREKLRNMSYEHWIHDDFLTWKWWLLLALAILPWVIWWKIVDKNRAHEILLYGCLIGIFTVILDNLGTELLWWEYPDKLFQMIPPMFPVDLTLVPVMFMVIFQIFTSFKPFLIANLIWGVFAAYIIEPVFVWLGYYQLTGWHPTYSIVFYMVATTLSRWIVIKTQDKQ